jgi:hypothetical protein
MSLPRRLALGVVVVAVVSVLVRLPATANDLHAQATKNDAYTGVGRMLAAADSLDIDNSFVVAANDTVPPNATYAVALPSRAAITAGTINEVTYDGVAPFMRYLLLPRRPAPLESAQYVLCYGCALHGSKFRWLWTGGADAKISGEKIGRRR